MQNNNNLYKPGSWFSNRYGISTATLRAWARGEKVTFITTPGGKRFYHISDVCRLLNVRVNEVDQQQHYGIIYACVSSHKQKPDLQRQIQTLQEAYPRHILIQDCASGVNFKRSGLRALLERVHQGMVSEVVVLHRDRLARIAVDLLEFIFNQNNTKLVVHCQSENSQSTQDDGYNELAEDLLAITTVFVASHNGKRSAQHRRLRSQPTQQKS